MPQTAGSAALHPESQCRYQFILIRTTTCWARSIPVPAPRASRPGGARPCPATHGCPERARGRPGHRADRVPAAHRPAMRRHRAGAPRRGGRSRARGRTSLARSCSTFLTRSPPTTERERLWSRFAPCWRMATRACRGWCCRKGRLAPRYAVTAPPALSGSMPSIRASGRPFLPRMPRFPGRALSHLPCAPCSASRPSCCCHIGTTGNRDRSAHITGDAGGGSARCGGSVPAAETALGVDDLAGDPGGLVGDQPGDQAGGVVGASQRPGGKWRRTISCTSGWSASGA